MTVELTHAALLDEYDRRCTDLVEVDVKADGNVLTTPMIKFKEEQWEDSIVDAVGLYSEEAVANEPLFRVPLDQERDLGLLNRIYIHDLRIELSPRVDAFHFASGFTKPDTELPELEGQDEMQIDGTETTIRL